jgi:hypothetical protein
MKSLAVLLIFDLCLHEGEVNKDLLLHKPLPTLTNGIEFF